MRTIARRGIKALMLASILLASCARHSGTASPAITFTNVPPFAAGSSNHLDAIEGRAAGALPGQKIVLYARSGEWWIQPLRANPFTTVQADFSWKSQTHPGSAYAALLVNPDYQPAPKTDVLPEKGGGVLAVAAVESSGPPRPAAKSLLFAGYEWQIRQTSAQVGGTENQFSPSNAWTAPDGFLHLRISGVPNNWKSAEISLRRSLGYGSYRFVVRGVSHLEPSAVFTMVVVDDSGPSREMDIEVSQWGEPSNRNGQFVIQPYHIPANTVQFQAPAGPTSYMLRWAPGRASFRAFRGAAARWDSPAIREHIFTSGVPSPGKETVRMNFYVFGDNRYPLQRESEVVVEAFEYLP